MESALDYHTAKALLDWQIEMGVDEAISDAPIDRYAATAAEAPKPAARSAGAAKAPPVVRAAKVDPVAVARQMAMGAGDLAALQAAVAAYEHCQLKRGARSLVFSGGHLGARVMIIGDAPGRDEDREGAPFVGPVGELLDRMLGAIGLDRRVDQADQAVYITHVLPWRPPQNRDPRPDEIQMMVPFLKRHVELVQPELVVLMGNVACEAALGQRGITRLRGRWAKAFGLPALPMLPPVDLLSKPLHKREAWADLLTLKARLEGM